MSLGCLARELQGSAQGLICNDGWGRIKGMCVWGIIMQITLLVLIKKFQINCLKFTFLGEVEYCN